MKATTEDWARIEMAAQAWGNFRCILDLRRRVEALEVRAAAPAPAADRPLWEVMRVAWNYRGNMRPEDDWAAAIDAMADWLAAREHCGAASALRIEARRAREGQ